MEEQFNLSHQSIGERRNLYDDRAVMVYLRERNALDLLLYNSEITRIEHTKSIDELTGDNLTYNLSGRSI